MILGDKKTKRPKAGRCALCWLLYAGFAPLTAQTEADTVRQIRRVEVVAQSTAQSATTTMAPVQQIGHATTERLGLTGVADVLKLMTGVSVRDYGGLGGMKTVCVRNLGAAHTAVSLDGVPVSNCQAGQIDIGRFTDDRLEAVRLHIGQVDDLLAPALLSGYTGVLQLTSMRPSATSAVDGHLSAASWHSFQEALSVDVPLRVDSLGELRQGVTLRGSHRSTDGNYPYTFRNGVDRERMHRQNSHMHGGQAEADWFGRWGRRTETDTKAIYYRVHQQLPGGIVYYNTYSREESREENAFVQSRLRTEWGSRWKAVALLKYNYAYTLHTDPLTAAEWQREVYEQHEAYAQASVSYRASEHWTLSAAEDLQWAALRSPRADCPDPLRRTSFTALRARFKTDRVTALASALYTAVRDTKSRDHDFVAPALSISWQLLSEQPFYLRALLRRAYRLPSFNDLYYTRIGNRNLRPERADEANVGVTYRRHAGHWSGVVTADYYEQYVHDKIVAVPGTFTWKMLNFERARLHGLDVTLASQYAWAAERKVCWNVGYMMQRAVDRTTLSRGSQLPYTPLHSGNGSVVVDHPWLSVGYTVQWMGERYSSRMNTSHYRLAPFADQSLTLSHTFCRGASRWMLYATVQNLADREYEVVQYYPMPGRQLRVGLRWHLASNKL
jgi:outer membrane cobalamin receptor